MAEQAMHCRKLREKQHAVQPSTPAPMKSHGESGVVDDSDLWYFISPSLNERKDIYGILKRCSEDPAYKVYIYKFKPCSVFTLSNLFCAVGFPPETTRSPSWSLTWPRIWWRHSQNLHSSRSSVSQDFRWEDVLCQHLPFVLHYIWCTMANGHHQP
jgi:hypothetical protein